METPEDFLKRMERNGHLRGIGDEPLSNADIEQLKLAMLQTSPRLEDWPALNRIMNDLLAMYPLQAALKLVACLGCAYWRLYGQIHTDGMDADSR